MISYEFINSAKVRVRLDGKLVGVIRRRSEGYKYFTTSGNVGEAYKTLAECKKSLEGVGP